MSGSDLSTKDSTAMSGSTWLSLKTAATSRPVIASTPAIRSRASRAGRPFACRDPARCVIAHQAALAVGQRVLEYYGDEILAEVRLGLRRPSARVLANQSHHEIRGAAARGPWLNPPGLSVMTAPLVFPLKPAHAKSEKDEYNRQRGPRSLPCPYPVRMELGYQQPTCPRPEGPTAPCSINGYCSRRIAESEPAAGLTARLGAPRQSAPASSMAARARAAMAARIKDGRCGARARGADRGQAGRVWLYRRSRASSRSSSFRPLGSSHHRSSPGPATRSTPACTRTAHRRRPRRTRSTRRWPAASPTRASAASNAAAVSGSSRMAPATPKVTPLRYSR